ncbi:MAG: helix-turn-helix transcriptional regulator [Bacteroidota bacterium]
MRLIIKNMVSQRCILKVDEELNRLGIPHQAVQMGFVDLLIDITPAQERELQQCFDACKLALLKRRKLITVERIKSEIIQFFYSEEIPPIKFSVYLSAKCRANYNYLSNVFVEETGCTIREFINKVKIERAKELIGYGELNFSEIAVKLQYCTVAYFSGIFKEYTGVTPSQYKMCSEQKRDGIENL